MGKQSKTGKRGGFKPTAKGNSKPGAYRSRRGSNEYTGEEEVQHKYNDVSWYAKNERMLKDAASFSYNSPLGNQLPMRDFFNFAGGTGYSFAVNGNQMTIPGLVALTYVPTIGLSTNSSSPANLAAQNIYTYVRYMNSGSKNYDQADLMMYLLAMDSIYMAWNWAKRIYGYASQYDQKNRYIPEVFAYAEGVDLNDIQSNLADYRLQLNSLAAQISSFCVPAVMPLFVRHSWLASNIYKDSSIEKAQMYMFVPDFYYVYDETGSENGGQLLMTPLCGQASGTTLKAADIIAKIKTALDKVAYSEDIGVMSGDILKAYGQEKLFKISPLEPDYTVIPTYNEEVLNQIHNSSYYPSEGWGDVDITQDPDSGYLIWDPTFTGQITSNYAFVNMPWDNVEPANTMVGTRLTSLLQSANATEAKFSAVGTEFITARRMCTFSDQGKVVSWNIHSFMIVTPTNIQTRLQQIAQISEFDWHPLVFVFYAASDTAKTYTFQGILGDVSNYTTINGWSLQQMHLTAILSEFNVPQIGSF